MRLSSALVLLADCEVLLVVVEGAGVLLLGELLAELSFSCLADMVSDRGVWMCA